MRKHDDLRGSLIMTSYNDDVSWLRFAPLRSVLLSCALAGPGCDRSDTTGSQGSRGEAAASSDVAPAAPRIRMPVPDHGFSLVLPADWVRAERTESGADVFRASDGSARVTVSVFSASPRMDVAKRDQTLSTLLQDRRAAERAIMGAHVSMGEPRRREQDHVVSAGYEGVDVDGHQRFATLVLASAAGGWTVYVESHEPSEAVFRAIVDGIFGSVGVDS
jgi:hypothetical protein